MRASAGVRDGINAFYDAFSSGDPARFADVIADVDGVSVLGSAPDEGHDSRAAWLASYEAGVAGDMAGIRLEGFDPQGWEEATAGFGRDTPSFVLPDGSRLPTRLTAVLRREGDAWKVVHLHFSVGVPDEDAVVPPGG